MFDLRTRFKSTSPSLYLFICQRRPQDGANAAVIVGMIEQLPAEHHIKLRFRNLYDLLNMASFLIKFVPEIFLIS